MQSTFKALAKQAKQRIKSGYWEKSFQEKSESIKLAKSNGVNESAVTKYYREKVISDLKNKNTEEENFYQKVKQILDNFGEVSDILGRLTDKEYLSTLSYEQKQRYLLSLSENYRKALARYKKEKEIFGWIKHLLR